MIASLLGFTLAFAESGLGLGAVVPGELAISSLAAVTDGVAGTLALGGAVALGATAGDHLGFIVGRRGGTRLRDSRLIARLGVGRWNRAARFVQRYGFWAMLASRLLPIVRTVMPVVAGSAGLEYRSFLLASILGAAAWSALWVGAGTGVARSGILDRPEPMAALLCLAVIVLGVRRLLLRRRGRRAGRSGHDDPPRTGTATCSASQAQTVEEAPGRAPVLSDCSESYVQRGVDLLVFERSSASQESVVDRPGARPGLSRLDARRDDSYRRGHEPRL